MLFFSQADWASNIPAVYSLTRDSSRWGFLAIRPRTERLGKMCAAWASCAQRQLPKGERTHDASLRLRVLAVAAIAAAVAVPVASAARYVQIGGALVAPEQVSSWQAQAGPSDSSRRVQIGGELVKPEQVSSWQASQAKSSVATSSTTSGAGFDWSDAGVGMGIAFGALLFIGSAAYVRRVRLTQG